MPALSGRKLRGSSMPRRPLHERLRAVVSGSRARLVLRWTAASLVGSAVAGGVGFALADILGMSRGGFFSFSLGAPLSFVLGFVVTLGWALVAGLPRFAALSLWVVLARVFGDTDGGRFRLLVGMA